MLLGSARPGVSMYDSFFLFIFSAICDCLVETAASQHWRQLQLLTRPHQQVQLPIALNDGKDEELPRSSVSMPIQRVSFFSFFTTPILMTTVLPSPPASTAMVSTSSLSVDEYGRYHHHWRRRSQQPPPAPTSTTTPSPASTVTEATLTPNVDD